MGPFKIRYVRYLNFFLIGIIGDYKKNYQKINRYTLTFCNSNLKLLLAYKNQINRKRSYLKVLTLNKYNHLINLKQFKHKKKNLITFKAPLNLVLNNFKQNEILSSKKKTKSVTWLTHYSNYLIVKWFKKKSKFLLNIYCCCHNLKKIKIFVDRILRYCAIKTLAIKNKLTIQKTIKNWSKNIIIKDKTNKLILIKYLT